MYLLVGITTTHSLPMFPPPENLFHKARFQEENIEIHYNFFIRSRENQHVFFTLSISLDPIFT